MENHCNGARSNLEAGAAKTGRHGSSSPSYFLRKQHYLYISHSHSSSQVHTDLDGTWFNLSSLLFSCFYIFKKNLGKSVFGKGAYIYLKTQRTILMLVAGLICSYGGWEIIPTLRRVS